MQKKQLNDPNTNTIWSTRKPLTSLDEIEKKYIPTDSNQFSPVDESHHKKEKVSSSCSLYGLFPGCFQIDTSDEEEATLDTRSTLEFCSDAH